MIQRKYPILKKVNTLSLAFNIQPILTKIGIMLSILLFFLQILHYYHVFQETLSPTYVIEGSIMGRDHPESPYGIFYFSANVNEGDEIFVKVNGIPITKIERNGTAFAYVSLLDIIEIDATNALGSYEVNIEAEPTHYLPHGFSKSIQVQGKLYRLPPLYKK